MTGCDAITRIVEQWEDQGLVAPSDLGDVSKHVLTCPQCDHRYAALMPFMVRDSSPGARFRTPRARFSVRTVNQIMERVRGIRPRRSAIPGWAGLVAACLLLAAGGLVGALITRNTPTVTAELAAVSFALEAPQALSVALVGSFNNWDPSQLMMKGPDHNGIWQITVLLPRNSTQVYNFVIDGQTWITDPRSTAQVNDGFGGKSSVLRL